MEIVKETDCMAEARNLHVLKHYVQTQCFLHKLLVDQ